MPTFKVLRKTDQAEVYRYGADAPLDLDLFPFAGFDHVEVIDLPAPEPDLPAEAWHIGVGPFWDRFGAYKIPILASADAVVQAIIKDSTVRKYLDLQGRRTEIAAAIDILIAKGFPLDKAAVIDTVPGPQEVYRG